MIRDDLVRMRHMLYTARKAVEFTDGKGREDLDTEGTYSLFVKKADGQQRVAYFTGVS